MARNGRILKLCKDAKASRTRQEKEDLKSIGCIMGHFSTLPVGHPPKAAAHCHSNHWPEPVRWKTADVKELLKLCTLESIHKLRACYLTTKIDPSVIVGGDDDTNNDSTEDANTLDEHVYMKPPRKLEAFKKYEAPPVEDEDIAMEAVL
ncbi:hypothetical protein IV203_029697 [Nitzschia inconspicua]|uniref:Uncharacterized protein n=1 Tax=Nitzschia inconspicua TaxID=303405 RepID=A0A9K3LRK0_9STRA|nr:hypothetical protein IV203_029697 [Nitzschia inconspicua]